MNDNLKNVVLNIVLKVYGVKDNQFGIRRTLAEVLDHLYRLSLKPETIIDVGVASGTFELYAAFREAKLILIEPLEEFERVLQKICTKHKNSEYILAAAGNHHGTASINVHTDLSTASLMNEMEGADLDGLPRVVSLVTIDEVCQKRKLTGPYVIKIDVQGAELIVLSGAQQVLKETELVILEVSLFQFYRNGPQLYDVVTYMKNQGFVVYDIFGGHTRPVDGALAQVDMAFVKENGNFRKNHSYATYEQRQKLNRFSLHVRQIRNVLSIFDIQ